jgi:hypothetical protein
MNKYDLRHPSLIALTVIALSPTVSSAHDKGLEKRVACLEELATAKKECHNKSYFSGSSGMGLRTGGPGPMQMKMYCLREVFDSYTQCGKSTKTNPLAASTLPETDSEVNKRAYARLHETLRGRAKRLLREAGIKTGPSIMPEEILTVAEAIIQPSSGSTTTVRHAYTDPFRSHRDTTRESAQYYLAETNAKDAKARTNMKGMDTNNNQSVEVNEVLKFLEQNNFPWKFGVQEKQKKFRAKQRRLDQRRKKAK